jgi:hypothetical protein
MNHDEEIYDEDINDMMDIIKIAHNLTQTYVYWHSEKNKNILEKMKLFITKFYMLKNPNIENLNQTSITDSIRMTFYRAYDIMYTYPLDKRPHISILQKIKHEIMNCATDTVNAFIKLIDEAPKKISIDEKMVAGVNKTCIDVLEGEDSAKLHRVLEDLDSVIFIRPAEYMGRGGPLPVNYKYLAFTYKKENIEDFFKTPERIQYCDTDPDNQFLKQKTPYILCPLNFNCDPAYVNLWQILHIIRSTQRIFYILPSHYLGGPKHKCMNDDKHSQEILEICICDGPDCWEWDENTECIKATDAEKIEIQTECNRRNFDEYTRRRIVSEKLEKLRKTPGKHALRNKSITKYKSNR